MKIPYKVPHLHHRQVPAHISSRSHAFGKIEPELGVRHGILARSTPSALLVAHVGQHGTPQLAFVQPQGQLGQIAGKCLDVMVVVAGILAQVVASQLSGGPRLIEWVAEQVVPGNRCLQLLEELSGIHDGLLASGVTLTIRSDPKVGK